MHNLQSNKDYIDAVERGDTETVDKMVGEALGNLMQTAGLDVITDHEEGQRVLDEENERVKKQVVNDLFRGYRGNKFFRTPAGEAYGFVKDGKIYIDSRKAGSEVYIHEYSHLWAEGLKQRNPKAWEKLQNKCPKS